MTEPTRFHAIVAGRNCENWVVRCLDSLASQERPFTSIQVLVDAGTDRTFDTAARWAEEHDPRIAAELWVTGLEKHRRGALANQCTMIERAHPNPEDVLVFVDLDDRLAHNLVLDVLGGIYDNEPDVECTYGSYRPVPDSPTCALPRPYPPHVIKTRSYRDYATQIDGGLLYNHLRTFRYRPFSEIDQDVNFKWPTGDWFMRCTDTAMMIPVLELAREHRFIDEPLYLYNSMNPLSDWRQDTDEIDRINRYILRRLKPIPPACAAT